MKLIKILRELKFNESAIIDDLSNFNTYNEFETFLKSRTDAEKHEVLAYIKQLNSNGACKNGVLLYHGTPSKNAMDIYNNGFKIGKGRRSGFMGSERIVDNKGIFLTNSKKMSNFFGNNRSERGDYVLIKVCAKIKNVLDITNPLKIDKNLRKVGLELVNAYNGGTKTKLSGKDIWWLLDQSDFVDKIIELGYDSVKFKEDAGVVKMSGDPQSFTYLVFDPKQLNVIHNINTLEQLFNYIKS